MNNKKINSTTYIIIGFIVMSIIIIGIVTLIYNINNNNKTAPLTAQPGENNYTDPGSGETIVSPDGKNPESFGVNPDAPIYVGFSNLLKRGFTDNQVVALKAALLDFAIQTKGKEKITEISLTVDSITHANNSETGESTYTFTLTMNRKTEYKAVVTDPDVASIAVSLYEKNGATPVFTSIKSS
jgi:hypothetical protein